MGECEQCGGTGTVAVSPEPCPNCRRASRLAGNAVILTAAQVEQVREAAERGSCSHRYIGYSQSGINGGWEHDPSCARCVVLSLLGEPTTEEKP